MYMLVWDVTIHKQYRQNDSTLDRASLQTLSVVNGLNLFLWAIHMCSALSVWFYLEEVQASVRTLTPPPYPP